MRKFQVIALLVTTAFWFSACSDPVAETAFKEEIMVEGYLITGEPIQGITIKRTQDPLQPYDAAKTYVNNATILIKTGATTIPLVATTLPNGRVEYSDPNKTLVSFNTAYSLHITMPDGKILTGETTTPDVVSWKKAPRKEIQFPIGRDSVTLPSSILDSNSISWAYPDPNFYRLCLSITCMDTLQYGAYLTPATAELNRRTNADFTDGLSSEEANERTLWGFVPASLRMAPTVWSAFRWFGKQEVCIWAFDDNMFRWFTMMNFQSGTARQYDPNQASIKGGLGVFGSASIDRDTIFLKKNQP